MNNKLIKYSILFFMFVFTLIFINNSITITTMSLDTKKENKINLSAEIPGEGQWIKNSDFSSQTYWYMESVGDDTDVDGNLLGNQGNFKIIGEHWTFSNISGIPDNISWTPTKKPGDSIYPDVFEVNQDKHHQSKQLYFDLV